MSIEMAKEWLKSAKLDLENIYYIINVEHLSTVVAFHSQQAIEKSLKAYLEYKEKKIPKTLLDAKDFYALALNIFEKVCEISAILILKN